MSLHNHFRALDNKNQEIWRKFYGDFETLHGKIQPKSGDYSFVALLHTIRKGKTERLDFLGVNCVGEKDLRLPMH